MIKRNIDDEEENELEFPIKMASDIQEVKEARIESNKTIPVSKGIPLTVYRNEGDELVLTDSLGNGIRIPTPKKYKDVKKGDVVYLEKL